jgi:hypothetical protein
LRPAREEERRGRASAMRPLGSSTSPHCDALTLWARISHFLEGLRTSLRPVELGLGTLANVRSIWRSRPGSGCSCHDGRGRRRAVALPCRVSAPATVIAVLASNPGLDLRLGGATASCWSGREATHRGHGATVTLPRIPPPSALALCWPHIAAPPNWRHRSALASQHFSLSLVVSAAPALGERFSATSHDLSRSVRECSESPLRGLGSFRAQRSVAARRA